MKLIDEKLIEEAARESTVKSFYEEDMDINITVNGLVLLAWGEQDFKAGVLFAEQQLTQKMIELVNYSSDFICYFIKGQNLWLSKKDYKTVKTTEQLLEEFLNQQK